MEQSAVGWTTSTRRLLFRHVVQNRWGSNGDRWGWDGAVVHVCWMGYLAIMCVREIWVWDRCGNVPLVSFVCRSIVGPKVSIDPSKAKGIYRSIQGQRYLSIQGPRYLSIHPRFKVSTPMQSHRIDATYPPPPAAARTKKSSLLGVSMLVCVCDCVVNA